MSLERRQDVLVDVLIGFGQELQIERLGFRGVGCVEGSQGRMMQSFGQRVTQFAVAGTADHLRQSLRLAFQDPERMNQLFFGQSQGGGHDRLGEEIIKGGMDLIAQVEHAVLDSHRLFGEEEMETGVLPQGGDGLWGIRVAWDSPCLKTLAIR